MSQHTSSYISGNKHKLSMTNASSVADYPNSNINEQNCVVYKFQSRPPYEGFVLILVIVVIVVVLLWWLTTKLNNSN